jgi:hypothetical protein
MSNPTGGSLPRQPHPDEWEHDLNPNFMAGMNAGLAGPHEEKAAFTAYEIKELHAKLSNLNHDELWQIIVLPEGARLEQGAKYLDLNDPRRREFTATADMVTGPDNYYVPKKAIDYQLWNRLKGVKNPERLGEGSQ